VYVVVRWKKEVQKRKKLSEKRASLCTIGGGERCLDGGLEITTSQHIFGSLLTYDGTMYNCTVFEFYLHLLIRKLH
jgi:hypothetical protein